MNASRRVARCWLATTLLLAASSGCANCRLPRIDPTGDRIFVPGSCTTVAAAPGGVVPHPWCPKSAFPTPPQPPACPHGTPPLAQPGAPPMPVLAAPAVAPKVEQVVVTPSRIIAPVGSEVVLMCGICGTNGHFVTRQPIEWALSQDSVGQFVEVGEGIHPNVARFIYQQSPKKVGSNFAVGYTTCKPQNITRGTATPTDDVQVKAGQNWISVTSASEGTSYVTALAPKVETWDTRKQSSTIYWVDAQWLLPPPTVARAGQKQTLSTTVSRPRGGPITGWLVRYEVTGGPAAGFAPTNSPAVEVQTDASGVAAVELVPSTSQPGVTQVSVQIIRPAGRAGDGERMVVGQGFTSVSWSAPGLAVKVTGPQVAGLGTTAVYRAEVSNPGDLVAKDVTASDVLPTGLVHVSSNPPGQIFGNRLEWRLGDIPGNTTRVIEITCRAEGQGDVQHCVKAKSGDGNATEGCAPTRLYSPAIKVTMTGPEQANVGEQAQFRVEITNTGAKPLTNVTMTDVFDAGFQHAQGARSPIVNVLGTLAPGETQRKAITFNCVAPGRPCHTLDVSADGEQTARQRACVTVAGGGAAIPGAPPAAPAEARLRVQLTGSRQQRVGELVEYTIEATNGGGVPLTGLRVSFNYPAAIVPQNATSGHKHEKGELSWVLNRLNAGEKQVWVVQCQCLKQDPLATSRVSVTSAQRATAEDQIRTEILPGAIRDPGDGGAAGRPPALDAPVAGAGGGNDLRASLNDLTDPARVGEKIEYTATLANGRTVSDKNVVVRIVLPEGMTLDGDVSGPVDLRGIAQDGRSAEFKPIAEVRASENLTATKAFRFGVKADRPGKYRVRLEIRSQRSPQPIVVDAETTVVGQ